MEDSMSISDWKRIFKFRNKPEMQSSYVLDIPSAVYVYRRLTEAKLATLEKACKQL